jgi:signal transduction histidine kinase
MVDSDPRPTPPRMSVDASSRPRLARAVTRDRPRGLGGRGGLAGSSRRRRPSTDDSPFETLPHPRGGPTAPAITTTSLLRGASRRPVPEMNADAAVWLQEDERPRDPSGRWDRSSRHAGLLGGLAALALSMAPLLLFAQVVEATRSQTERLVAALVLVQLPVFVGVRTLLVLRRARERVALGAAAGSDTRAQQAEAALARERDRLHQLRATVVGITLSHALLNQSSAELTASARARLERLHGSELARLERMLGEDHPDSVEVVDLATIIDPLVDAIRLRGHTVSWTGTRAQAWGRRDEVAEIVHVLLENAAQHGGGSPVHVEVADAPDDVEVRVRDLGPGVPPELVQVVFERGVHAADSSGQGLGLHIALRLARQMGGELRLEPTAASPGAQFVLHLGRVAPSPNGGGPPR